jgi:multiple sugar transport system permease protein
MSKVRAGDVATYSGLTTIAVFSLAPMLWMFVNSLKPDTDMITAGFQFLPSRPTFENYVAVWTQSAYPTLISNSLAVTAITLAICMTLGSVAAFALSRFSFPGRRLIMTAIIRARMFPIVLMLAPLFIVLNTIGLVDTRLGLALAYSSVLLPAFIWIAKVFMDRVPRDFDDAARLEGASSLTIMTRIVMPLAFRGLFAAGLFTAIGAWNEFLFALMFTSSQGSRTWPVGLQLMVGQFQLPWGMLAAGGILSVAPVVVLFVFGGRVMRLALATGTKPEPF